MNDKKKLAPKKYYDREFKLNAVRLVTVEGMSMAQVARDLGINDNNISRWVQQYGNHKEQSFPGKGKPLPDNQELKRLRQDNKRLAMECDILKKAITFFRQHEE